MLRGGSNRSSVLASRGAAPALPDPNGYNPMDFLRNHFQTLYSGGPRIQFTIVDNNPSEGGFMLCGGSNCSSVLASRGAAPALPDPNGYNPMDFLRNHFQTLHSGGPWIQFVEQHNLRGILRRTFRHDLFQLKMTTSQKLSSSSSFVLSEKRTFPTVGFSWFLFDRRLEGSRRWIWCSIRY